MARSYGINFYTDCSHEKKNTVYISSLLKTFITALVNKGKAHAFPLTPQEKLIQHLDIPK